MATYIIAYYLVDRRRNCDFVDQRVRILQFNLKISTFNLIAEFYEKRFTTINKNNRIRSSSKAKRTKKKITI